MKLQFVPHGKEPRGYSGPTVDLHDRWLVPPRYVSVDDPQCDLILTPGQFIDLDEGRQSDRHFIEWARSHPDFKVVNSSPHPEAALWKR